jgi:Glycosyltransferase family 87
MERALNADRSATSERPPFRPTRQLHLLAPLAAALALIPIAVSIRHTADFGLAYQGGVEAWASGHPERVSTWFSTPFLAFVMAVITRLTSEVVGAHLFLAVNVLLWGGLLVAVWSQLYGRVASRWWWGTLIAAALFSPGISTIFWLNFNLVVFVLALGGFVLVGRHNRLAGLLIGASLASKPILLLLPLALLMRRESRSAGVWALVVAAVFSAGGLAFLAWRAGDWTVLDPVPYFADFAEKTRRPFVTCVIQNYSQQAFLCRLGVLPSTALTVGLAAAVGGIGYWLTRRFRRSSSTAWELFAAACLLSPMLGPIQWATYQLLFAPLMLLLAYQFWAEGAPRRLWVFLVVAYLMTDAVWDPLETLARTPLVVLVVSYLTGQFAQYVLLLTWARWLSLRKGSTA